jgi:hypothetical protein
LWEGKTAAMERGDIIHLCWNRFLETGHPGNSGAYSDWVSILIDDPLWKKLKPIALEHELIDRTYFIAGKFDGLFYNTETEEIVLIDLKTFEQVNDDKGEWSTYKKGRHRKQLGGYVDLIHINYPDVSVDKCMVVHSSQRGVFYETYPDVERCRADYQLARRAFIDKQRKLHAF